MAEATQPFSTVEPESPQKPAHPTNTSFQEKLYFLCGTLMDPSTLASVLKQPSQPGIYSTYISGYSIKLWGDYPAPVDEVSDQTIRGFVCRVRSRADEDRLAQYETDMYRVKDCVVHFGDGSRAAGVTFVWNGDMSPLREGKFDLKDWVMKREFAILGG